MRIGMLAPVAWRTPPRHYGPWELIVSLITEGLVARGHEVTLFATGDSITAARLASVVERGWEEVDGASPKVMEALHISHCFERASEFDVIHNHFDFLPLSYAGLIETPVVTTIHGFSSEAIVPVYEKYDGRISYVSISDADRHPRLHYEATVYHGIDLDDFTARREPDPQPYLIFFGRMHEDKGAKEAIEIARAADMPLVMAGIIQDQNYFERWVEPHLGERIRYVGSVGPRERDRLLGGARAMLHPIGFDEPFGLSVVESQACGTPVVAFDRGSMPEVIADQETGFLVDDVASAAHALSAIGRIDRLACRRHVERRFSRDRMVDDYARVYERVRARAGA